MGVNAERRLRGGLPGWVEVLVGIVVLVYVVWAFGGLTWLTDCGHPSPAIHAHVRVMGSTIPTFKAPTPRTTTPSTTQIVPLPPNNSCPSCIPQPSFAPAP